MNEIWRDIKGLKGSYQVSNTGKVKSLKRIVVRNNGVNLSVKERILKQSLFSNGYMFVNIGGKPVTVHRLVAEAFIDNPLMKRTVNHIDCDKTNNIICNLEWATYQENERHAWANGLKKPTWLGKFGSEHNRSLLYKTA